MHPAILNSTKKTVVTLVFVLRDQYTQIEFSRQPGHTAAGALAPVLRLAVWPPETVHALDVEPPEPYQPCRLFCRS